MQRATTSETCVEEEFGKPCLITSSNPVISCEVKVIVTLTAKLPGQTLSIEILQNTILLFKYSRYLIIEFHPYLFPLYYHLVIVFKICLAFLWVFRKTK